jgi:hypothetical protein
VPYILFGPVAQGLAALEAGDGSILFSIAQQAPPFQCDCSNDTVPFHLNNGEAVFAIQCGDAVEVKDTLEELRAFYDNAAKTSQFVEFLVGSNRVSCAYVGLNSFIRMMLIPVVDGRCIERVALKDPWLQRRRASRSYCLPLVQVRGLAHFSLTLLTSIQTQLHQKQRKHLFSFIPNLFWH